MEIFGAIEAGGTKINCLVAESHLNIIQRCQIPTQDAELTTHQIIDFFNRYQNLGLKRIGLACFGPLVLDPESPDFGLITKTPKKGWDNFNLKNVLEEKLKIAVTLDTDVNAAGLGEYRWGAAQKCSVFLYLTIGTGIGGAAFIDGVPHSGISHPEMGHIYIPQDISKDPFPGICPYHRNCFEGLACGPSLRDRWGPNFLHLPQGHLAWDLESTYIAYALISYIYTFSPERIIIGGGVMQQKHLLPKVRSKVKEYLNNYNASLIEDDIDNFLISPALGNDAGVLGALFLAMKDAAAQ